MPELPEVETVRRGLAKLLTDRAIARVEILDQRLVQPYSSASVEQLLAGKVIESIDRRGKYLLIHLNGGIVALHHLRMTGSFAAPNAEEPKHVRMLYHIKGIDGPLRYNDPRRFGTLLVDTSERIAAYLDMRLGPEPLSDDWTAKALQKALERRTGAIKAALLNQKVVAGLGNIYVDDALFLAGIRPDKAANEIKLKQLERLIPIVKERLLEAISVGGSTLRDYRGVEGKVGEMQERFVAYGRGGLPCLNCGSIMRSSRIAGRGTSWCANCQK